MSTPPSTSGAEPSPRHAGAEAEKSRYRSTLNLPKTAFPMKANLVQNEPLSIRRWSEMDVYGSLRRARAGRPKFVFHDGPPYANGSIHLGHFLNKSLKDFVVRSRSMMGMDCPFVPGWDCHGLPIEHRVMQEMLEKGKLAKVQALPEDQRRMVVRRECQAYAEKYVKLHVEQMTRALTLADYAHPYLTMQPSFEGATLEVLAALVEQGLVYRALKPVHWSIANETALAEAELEYEERVDLSVYVDFEAADADAVYDAFGLPPHTDAEEEDEDEPAEGEGVRLPRVGVRPNVRPSFMIWTTTPWTLPANLAIAVNARFEYALVYVDGNVTVMAAALVEKVTALAKAEHVRVLASTTGDRLVGLGYRHPFVDHGRGEGVGGPAVFTVAAAEYVTLEDGTGLVHTAPGHGTEDFQTGARMGLPVYCPVRADGTYDRTVPEWLRGMDIWKANEAIVSRLEASGHLFHSHRFTHSYPHDWRSKTPVIFRCTEQWFVGVDVPMARDGTTLRAGALSAIDASRTDAVRFVPEWGRNRMRGMLESRPDWCISRQRAWGLPIPAFFWRDAHGHEHALLTPSSVRAVARLVREKGADAWFQSTPETLLSQWDPAGDRDLPAWWTQHGLTKASVTQLRKGPDILDVWFESGSTWNAAMRERSHGADFPSELYLEGADQHRGWFQSSLLPALGMMGRAPYKALLTHGFTVDKDGRKLSKSSGDTIEELYAGFGADVLRWWVASQSYENDMKVDRSFFELSGESYRKVRNTLRFMLSNLSDAPRDLSPVAEPCSIDAWVLGEYARVADVVVSAYRDYDFASSAVCGRIGASSRHSPSASARSVAWVRRRRGLSIRSQ
ncbi:isoleucine--tRNA ligase [Leptolyngbya sp. 15MV]|nr:isoleucine--tRNA ligase [Leptolyngbya sp. 15MV]